MKIEMLKAYDRWGEGQVVEPRSPGVAATLCHNGFAVPKRPTLADVRMEYNYKVLQCWATYVFEDVAADGSKLDIKQSIIEKLEDGDTQ